MHKRIKIVRVIAPGFVLNLFFDLQHNTKIEEIIKTTNIPNLIHAKIVLPE